MGGGRLRQGVTPHTLPRALYGVPGGCGGGNVDTIAGIYRLVWDVMTHNMNQLIDKGGLDLTLDETTWPNSSYADIQGCLQGKKTDNGGQHVLLLDFKR